MAEVLEGRQLLATITVNTTGDADGADGSGTLSLRQAIEISNGSLAVGSLTMSQSSLVSGPLSSPNTIDFDIPGTGPFVIAPTSSLPSISSVVIDGYSQPGSHPNTNGPGQGKNTVLQIELDGRQAGAFASGLSLGQDSTVEGLAIGGFYNGLSVGGIMGNLSHDLVVGNFIGTDVTGAKALPNGQGILMFVGPFGSGGFNTIGGTAAGAGNVISGNSGDGLTYGNSCLVEGNFIGTDVTGTEPLPNGGQAITPAIFGETLGTFSQYFYATNATIGGTVAGAGNVFLENQDNDAVTSAVVGQSGTLISGTLNSNASTSVTVNVFADLVGSYQGRANIGSTVVTTDAKGQASFSFVSSLDLHGQAITFSTTDSNGNTTEYASSAIARDLTTIQLVGSQVATLGRPTTFAAVVEVPLGGVPTGLVDFLQDGAVIGSAPINASGVAVFITKSLAPGLHTITAAYAGDSTQAPSQSNAVSVSVFAPHAFGGPAVTSTSALAPDTVTIVFNRGLMPEPAENVANYTIIGPGHRAITIDLANYDPATATVTLATIQDLLTPGQSYQLTINGQTGDRVVDVFGIALDGKNNRKPGHDYVGKFTVKNAPAVKVAHPAGPKAHATASKKGH